MEYLAKQTYLYLALQETLKQLGLQSKQGFMTSRLLAITYRKLKDIMQGVNSRQQKVNIPKTHMKGFITLDSEFLYGESEHPKLKAVIYGVGLPMGHNTTAENDDVAILEVFASKNEGRRPKTKPKVIRTKRSSSQDSASSLSFDQEKGKKPKAQTKRAKKPKIN